MMKGKPTKGRQKIEMKPIKNMQARQVCFSKRRPSLFKKANELSILCGAKVAVVVFSPGQKSYSFGHPSVNSVFDHFLGTGTMEGHAVGGGGHRNYGVTDTVQEIYKQHAKLEQQMEAEKKRKERVQEAIVRESGGCVMKWVTSDVRELGLEELEEFYSELAALEGIVNWKISQMLQEAKQTRKPLLQSHMHMATSSSPFLFGGESSTQISTILPSSFYGLNKGIGVNSILMLNGFDRVGGSGDCFNHQSG